MSSFKMLILAILFCFAGMGTYVAGSSTTSSSGCYSCGSVGDCLNGNSTLIKAYSWCAVDSEGNCYVNGYGDC